MRRGTPRLTEDGRRSLPSKRMMSLSGPSSCSKVSRSMERISALSDSTVIVAFRFSSFTSACSPKYGKSFSDACSSFTRPCASVFTTTSPLYKMKSASPGVPSRITSIPFLNLSSVRHSASSSFSSFSSILSRSTRLMIAAYFRILLRICSRSTARKSRRSIPYSTQLSSTASTVAPRGSLYINERSPNEWHLQNVVMQSTDDMFLFAAVTCISPSACAPPFGRITPLLLPVPTRANVDTCSFVPESLNPVCFL
mmetsp:Transcript_19473/g.48812  ORF Transcript_19473/g.48812 Transcript_19473/m.48812 type:complete len:254 (-) Transcript_19473:965-1726(-)